MAWTHHDTRRLAKKTEAEHRARKLKESAMDSKKPEIWAYAKSSETSAGEHWTVGLNGEYVLGVGERGDYMALSGITTQDRARAAAAAPEMLEALKLLEEAFCSDDYGTREGRHKARVALMTARAAIEKATRGEPYQEQESA